MHFLEIKNLTHWYGENTNAISFCKKLPSFAKKGLSKILSERLLDPSSDEDKLQFINWMIKDSVFDEKLVSESILKILLDVNQSPAYYASMKSEIKARKTRKGDFLTLEEVLFLIDDIQPADLSIGGEKTPPFVESLGRYSDPNLFRVVG